MKVLKQTIDLCKVMKKVSLKKFIECYRKIIKKYDNLIKIFVKIIKAFEDVLIQKKDNKYFLFGSIEIKKFEKKIIDVIIDDLTDKGLTAKEKKLNNHDIKCSEIYHRELLNLISFYNDMKSLHRFKSSEMPTRRPAGRWNNNNVPQQEESDIEEEIDNDDYEDQRAANIRRNEEALNNIMNQRYEARENYSTNQREFTNNDDQDDAPIDYGLMLMKFIGHSHSSYFELFNLFYIISTV